jgi:hypothetical protein
MLIFFRYRLQLSTPDRRQTITEGRRLQHDSPPRADGLLIVDRFYRLFYLVAQHEVILL